MSAARCSCAQSGGGAVSGKLTDLYSRPLAHTSVRLRNLHSGFEVHTITERNGSYRFAHLPPGEYVLEAENPERGSGRLNGIEVAAGHEAHVQAALALERQTGANPLQTTLAQPPPVTRPGEKQDTPIALPALRDGAARVVPSDQLRRGEIEAVPAQDDVTDGQLAEASANAHGGAAEPADGAVRLTSPARRADQVLSRLPETKRPEEKGVERAEAFAAAPSLRFPHGLGSMAPATPGISGRQSGYLLAAVCGLQARQQAASSSQQGLELAAAGAGTPGTLQGEELQQLPLADRDWVELVLERPERRTEVLQEDAGGKGSSARWPNGSGGFRLDGAPVGLAFGGHRSGRGMEASLLGVNTNASVLRDVAPATLARGGLPGTAELRTSSGGSALHGQAAILDRQNLWGAQNPLTSWVKETLAAAAEFPTFSAVPYTTPDRTLTMELAAGGPLKGKRWFWFAGIDQASRNHPGVATVKHPDDFFAQPSNDEMQLLSARLELSQADPVGEGLAAYGAGLRQLATVLGSAPRSSTKRTGFARLDWQGGGGQVVTVEALGSLWDAPGGGMTRASEPYGHHSFGSDRASDLWLLGRWQAFATRSLRAVAQGSVGRHILMNAPETPSPYEKTLLASAWGQLPQMVIDSRYGLTIGTPARFGTGSDPDEKVYQGQETLDWFRGSLLLRTGLEWQHHADATGFVRNHLGTFSYARVENFIADALVFAKYGLSDALDPANQHNCDTRAQAWRDASGQLHGLGYLPCYAHYTQMTGPTDWYLSTNDWTGFGTAQWQAAKRVTMSAGMRWQYQQMPPPVAKLINPDLPLAGRIGRVGNEWSPRFSVAWGGGESRLPTVRAGYGMVFGRTANSVLEAVLTRTGSTAGDSSVFVRPTDNLASGGAPPFPYVLAGSPGTAVKPSAVEMRSGFRNPEVHEAEMTFEERLAGKMVVSATAQVSLARHLPVAQDTNLDPQVNPGTITYTVVDATGKGPLKGTLTIPFFASWPTSLSGGRLLPGYQKIVELSSRANSTYEAATVRVSRNSRRGLNLHARYTYAHAVDWNPYMGAGLQGSSMLDPTDFRLEFGASDLDVRHSGSASVIWEAPWRVKQLGRVANGWKISGMGHFSSGLPYTMRTAGAIPAMFQDGEPVVGLEYGMNGSGGDDRVYGVGRNTFRYPATWKADVRAGKRFEFGRMRDVEIYAESFNLFNHKNVTLLETTGYTIGSGGRAGGTPTLNYLTGIKTGQTEFGQPLDVNAVDFLRPRQVDFGMRMRF